MLKINQQFSFKANRLTFYEGAHNNEADKLIKRVEQGTKIPLKSPEIDQKKLTAKEIDDVKEKRTSIPKLAAERDQAKTDFERTKNNLLLDGEIRDQQKLNEFIEKINITELESPELIKEAIKALKELPKEIEKNKKNAQEKAKEEAKELSPDAPERAEFKKEMNDILEKEAHLVHDKVPYQKWIDENTNKKGVSIKDFKKLKEDFEGKFSKDPNGLYERRQVFNQLQTKFTKYGLSSPSDSPLINKSNKKDREKFLYNIASLESHFKTVSDQLYDRKIIQKIMQSSLKATSLSGQSEITTKAELLQRKESTASTYLDSTMSIEGVTIRKMSQKGRDQFIKFYKTQNLSERLTNIDMWKGFIESEADLAKDLLKVYTKKDGTIDQKGFRKAMNSFEELNFGEKEAAIKEHKGMIDKKESDEVLHYQLTEKAAISKVKEAYRKKIISEETADKYKAWFSNPTNFKNEESKKPGDLKALEKQYALLTQTASHITANEKNLAAFEEEQKKFELDLKQLRQISPEIKEKELKKWRKRYNSAGWKERESIHKELIEEQKDQKQLGLMQKPVTESATAKGKDKINNREKAPASLEELKTLVLKLANNEQGLEANIKLSSFLQAAKQNNEYDKYKNNNTIKFLWGVIQAAINSFGMGELIDEDEQIKAIEDTVEDISETNVTMKENLLESYLKRRNLEGVDQNIDRHNKVEDAETRAKTESIESTSEGSTEAIITEDFYEQTDSNTILDQEGQGAEIRDIELGNSNNSEEIQSLRAKMLEGDQAKIDTSQEGIADVAFTIEGQKVSIAQAESKIDQTDATLDEELASLAQERMAASLTRTEKNFANSTQGHAAAIRAAKKLREEKVETEKLKR